MCAARRGDRCARTCQDEVHCPGGPRPPSAGRAARNRTGCRSRTRRARWVPYPGAASARARLRPRVCACSTAWARQVGQVPGQAAGRGGAEVVIGADGAGRGYEGVRGDHKHQPRPKDRPPLRTASDLSTCRAPASGDERGVISARECATMVTKGGRVRARTHLRGFPVLRLLPARPRWRLPGLNVQNSQGCMMSMSGMPTGSREARERCAGGAGAAGTRGAPILTTSTAATCP